MVHKLKLSGIFAAAFIAVFALFVVAYGEVSFTESTQTNNYQIVPLLSATTTSATSTNQGGGGGYAKIAGAKKVEIVFTRTGRSHANTGQTIFRVQVSPDGTNWYDFARLMNATSTSQTGQSTVTLQGTSTAIQALDLRTDTFYGVRCIAFQITDGEHTCSANAEF